MLSLRPSDIHYSQDSINNYFDSKCNHSGVLIGQTLDDICDGRTNINSIPRITVVNRNGKWVTADNRRLWLFRQLERLGKCTNINVYEGYSIPAAKLTSTNGGVTVYVRRSPGGNWHSRSASFYNDNSVFRNVHDIYGARPYSSESSRINHSYSSPPTRVQPTHYEYPQHSYSEPRKNDSWCNIL
ncbi:uncharacterized protein LOC127864356 [Dreissena polymorpha]|uniref:Uncharacterized protein n=1 Tax=Dreissena polymorpha TaxID=45954 RepID=A0A9D4NK82_DREPO|nr:uncharacterized protein LOC127864356 [Dreissena polymorpha]KAH3896168.1 hypothetical protein DPMN_020341 [Dreissena polymorpha]